DADAFRPAFEAALGAAEIACVHLKLGASEAGEVRRIIQLLAPLAQAKGAAVLIDPPADLREVARLGVDGVHITDVAGYPAATEALKPDRIVGVAGVTSRHDAMTAGEADIDYLMFGEPKADGYVPPLEKVIERCTWWAEVFVTPCIGYAPTADAVRPLAETNAEFIALGPSAFDGSGQAVAAAAKVLAEVRLAREAAERGR
ncbi:MAG: thiamine phosphate synthase, partial [Beijerinckiaceae bacterium]